MTVETLAVILLAVLVGIAFLMMVVPRLPMVIGWVKTKAPSKPTLTNNPTQQAMNLTLGEVVCCLENEDEIKSFLVVQKCAVRHIKEDIDETRS